MNQVARLPSAYEVCLTGLDRYASMFGSNDREAKIALFQSLTKEEQAQVDAVMVTWDYLKDGLPE